MTDRVKQLKEKAQLEARIAAQKALLKAELTFEEAKHKAGRKEFEAMLLKERLVGYILSDCLWDLSGKEQCEVEAMSFVEQECPYKWQ